MKSVKVVILFAVLLITVANATIYTDRAQTAMGWMTDPVNSMFYPPEGLVWIASEDTIQTAPAADNIYPAYLGSYFWTTAGLLAGMNATDIGVPYGYNGIERVFITNFNSGDSIADGMEPWWNESTELEGWLPDSLLIWDALIPWRFDPDTAFATDTGEVYLERVIWTMYILTLCENIEYSPFIAKLFRGIHQNPSFYDDGTGAVLYDGNGNVYLTALWGLALESYLRSFEHYPARARPGLIPTEEEIRVIEATADDAWGYVWSEIDNYMTVTLPTWWAAYHGAPTPTEDRGLERWEYLPIVMFSAIRGNILAADSLWNNHVDDVGVATWRDDVRAYFRAGNMWLGGRGFWEPLHRRYGVTAFWELCQVEMYRATLWPDFVERILEREDNWWNTGGRWTGDHWINIGANDYGTTMWNGLHAWTLEYLPNIEIVSMESSLPHEADDILPFDYFANINQDHTVIVKVTNNGHVPVGNMLMDFIELHAMGFDFGWIPVPVIDPGETVDVIYNVGGPPVAGLHQIWCTFDPIANPHLVNCYTVSDSDLAVMVQNPPELDMGLVIGDPETAPRSPFITHNSDFNVLVRLDNIGGGWIHSVHLKIYQDSPYGLSFAFPFTEIDTIIDLLGPGITPVFFPATAPDGLGAMAIDDIHVWVEFLGAIDGNTMLPIPSGAITYTDDEEYFDIQGDAVLTATSMLPPTAWINVADTQQIVINFSNLIGDVATADSMDVYEQSVELIASVVTGIGGTDAPAFVTPVVPAGGAGVAVFDLYNMGTSENALVDVSYTGRYHDGNRGDLAEAPASPMTGVFSGLGIDIFYPFVQPVAPLSGYPWPADDWVWVSAVDNLSGVAWVIMWVADSIDNQYWNFTTGTYQPNPDTIVMDPAGGSDYNKYLPTHPVDNCVMYLVAADVAGNISPPRRVPIGTDIPLVHLVDIYADLWRGSPEAPVPPGSDYDYECDTSWTYMCSLRVQNMEAEPLINIWIDLYSIYQPHTQITNLTGLVDLDPSEEIWYKFNVTAPPFSCVDSLFAQVVSGTDTFGVPAGQWLTYWTLNVLVETPVEFEIVDVYCEPADINVWLGDTTDAIEDTALVTEGQQFHVNALVRNNGEDIIDSIEICLDENPVFGDGISPGCRIFYVNFNGEPDTLMVYTVTTAYNSGNNPEQWDQDLELAWDPTVFTANNHPPSYTTGLTLETDYEAPVGIQDPPDMLTAPVSPFLVNGDDSPPLTTWINMTNTVSIELWLMNDEAPAGGGPPDNDRAAADRFLTTPDYSAELDLWAAGWWTTIDHILGIDASYFIFKPDTFMPGDYIAVSPAETLGFDWFLSWDGDPSVYEGYVAIRDFVKYGDENYQSQMYPWTSPHCDSFVDYCGHYYLGIDVTRPIVEIVYPLFDYYKHFPETLEMVVTDNVSGVFDDSVKVLFEYDYCGVPLRWDGTTWRDDYGPGQWWFTAHRGDADTFWYALPKPDMEGCYTYYAFAYDSAGNASNTMSTSFIYDVTAAVCSIYAPDEPGYYSSTGCPENMWPDTIRVWAKDTSTCPPCVSHVWKTFVAIKDTLQNKWWDGSIWITSSTAPWLECSPVSADTLWEYTGFSDPITGVLEIYSYTWDSAYNISPAPCDTLKYIILDNTYPNSVLTGPYPPGNVELPDPVLFGPNAWITLMNARVWGYASDSIVRVDSVRYSIWDDFYGEFWNGTSFVSGPELWLEPDQYNYNRGGWFTPDTPSHAGGIAMDVADTLFWRSTFMPPHCGWYRLRSRSYDDICHMESGHDSQNEKWILYDNAPPVIEPRYPTAGCPHFLADDWRDSLVVYAWDSCGDPLCGVDSVNFWIVNPNGEYWGFVPTWMGGHGWSWYSYPIRVKAQPMFWLPGDSLWYYQYPGLVTMDGTYHLWVRAYDCVGNVAVSAWCWSVSTCERFLTYEDVEAAPYYFVGDTIPLRVIAWANPLTVDTTFTELLDFGSTMPDPLDFEILTPGPYYTYRGTLDLEVVVHEPILGLVAFVDASGYPRASTAPIDVVIPLDELVHGFVTDNLGDQGDWLWIHHNRTEQDPQWGGPGIDTLIVKVLEYRYYRDMDGSPAAGDTNWAQILAYDASSSDGDSVRILFDNFGTFVGYEYSMLVRGVIQGLGIEMWSDRIMLDIDSLFQNGEWFWPPVDNIQPAAITDLVADWIGGTNIRLDWSEVTTGPGPAFLPEINPAANIVYDVYRSTLPYDELPAVMTLVTTRDVPFYIDPTSAGDVTEPHFYNVVARDAGENKSDGSNRVGEVDYEIGVGWNTAAYPLGVAGVDSAHKYVAELGAGLYPVYTYIGGTGWQSILVGTISDPIVPELEDMLVYSASDAGTYAWTGNVPDDSTNIFYNLVNISGNGWNGIMIPLHYDDATTASELYFELQAMGMSPVTIARRVPGGGWDAIVVIDDVPYTDFDIYRGQAYLVWVDANGTWPDYPTRAREIDRDAGISPEVQDAVQMPICGAVPIVAEDGAELDEVTAIAKLGEDEIECKFNKGMLVVEFSDFGEINGGEEVLVEISAEDGVYEGTTTLRIPYKSYPVNVMDPVVLAKVGQVLPDEFALHGNIPNPFNATTAIKFDLPEDADCELAIFNMNGRMVKKLVSEKLDAGYHRAVWSGTDNSGQPVPAGVYFYTFRAGDFNAKHRMLLVK